MVIPDVIVCCFFGGTLVQFALQGVAASSIVFMSILILSLCSKFIHHYLYAQKGINDDEIGENKINIAIIGVGNVGVSLDYLYHILKSNIFKDFIRRSKPLLGSAISHLYQRDLNNFEIDPPSLEEQKKVAKVFNAIDLKIFNNNKIISVLESMTKIIYDNWVLRFEFSNEGGKIIRVFKWKDGLERGIETSGSKEIESIKIY